MKKTITTILISIIFFTVTDRAHADSYAITGMLIGAGTGAAFSGVLIAADNASGSCSDDCDLAYLAVPMIAGLGALLGAGIGGLIPKDSKITFSPTIAPTQHGVTAGGNLAIRF